MKSKIESISLSGIRSFTALCAAMEDMVFLTIGEPDYDTPQSIKEAAIAALNANKTHYPPALGIDALLNKIAEIESKKALTMYTKNHVIVTNGATEGLVLALWSILNEGDEVIQFTPTYTSYRAQTALIGSKLIEVDTLDSQFQINKENLMSKVTKNTKAMILTSPNNPTGTIYNKTSLDAINELLKLRPDITLILDDVYSSFIYTKQQTTLRFYPDIQNQIVVVQSFSKSYAMTGWRIGYVLASEALIDRMHKLHQNLVTGITTFVQEAAITALDVDIQYMIDDYQGRRDYVYDRLIKMGLEVEKPEGAFYIFPKISKFKLSSYDFSLKLAKEAKVAVIPGVYFGADEYIRISYCYSLGVLKRALDRMEIFIKSL